MNAEHVEWAMNAEDTAHAIMRISAGIVADQKKDAKVDALAVYQDVMDSVDAHLNLLQFQHAIQTRDAAEIGRLILKCHDKDQEEAC